MLSLLVTVLAAMAATKVQAKLPANCDRNATVVAGDTCNGISAKYSVSTYQLANVNQGIIDADCQNLYVGQVICLGLKGQDCEATHVVQYGDTCLQIADEFHISVDTILANNPNVNANCTNTYPGEVLCVSSTIYVNSTKSS